MKVTLLQTDIIWGNPRANIQQAETMILENPGSDLYILPEMWSTGFATDPHGIAEEENSSISLKWMKTIAKQQKCAICGSLAIKTADGSYYNRQYFIDGRNFNIMINTICLLMEVNTFILRLGVSIRL